MRQRHQDSARILPELGGAVLQTDRDGRSFRPEGSRVRPEDADKAQEADHKRTAINGMERIAHLRRKNYEYCIVYNLDQA